MLVEQGLAAAMADAIRAGKDENAAIEAANASKWAKGPEPPKLLEDPVTIPTAGSPVRGPEDAALTLVEFSDFQCPYCLLAVAKLNAVLDAYPGKIKLIFKQFPLDMHSQAALAAAAAIAAHRQGKFWPMHDALFAHRRELSRPMILALARTVGLDMQRFAGGPRFRGNQDGRRARHGRRRPRGRGGHPLGIHQWPEIQRLAGPAGDPDGHRRGTEESPVAGVQEPAIRKAPSSQRIRFTTIRLFSPPCGTIEL